MMQSKEIKGLHVVRKANRVRVLFDLLMAELYGDAPDIGADDPVTQKGILLKMQEVLQEEAEYYKDVMPDMSAFMPTEVKKRSKKQA